MSACNQVGKRTVTIRSKYDVIILIHSNFVTITLLSGESRYQMCFKQKLAAAANKSPKHPYVKHQGLTSETVYNCHQAALHWAQIALGRSETQAHHLISWLAVSTCQQCSSIHTITTTIQFIIPMVMRMLLAHMGRTRMKNMDNVSANFIKS